MIEELKPLETYYKGYRFRSRLEARWAVFFDTVGIEWEYEKEGYVVKNRWSDKTYYYLPDFYLPKTNTWVEVKGDLENVDISYWEMLGTAVDYRGYLPHVTDSWGSERGILILSTLPYTEEEDTVFSYPCIQHFRGVHVSQVMFFDGGLKFVNCGSDDHDAARGDIGKTIKDAVLHYGAEAVGEDECKRTKQAYFKARSARFEHGESV